MNINSLSSLNFKGCVPVTFYSYDKEKGRISRIDNSKQKRKCENIVIRNLNHTKKGDVAPDFVQFYKGIDRDYNKYPIARSFYNRYTSEIFLVTGDDAALSDSMAKPLGIAKAQSRKINGTYNTDMVEAASNRYHKEMAILTGKSSNRVKSASGENLNLNVYFEPKYSKKGELKEFKYIGANFTDDGQNVIYRTHNSAKYRKDN